MCLKILKREKTNLVEGKQDLETELEDLRKEFEDVRKEHDQLKEERKTPNTKPSEERRLLEEIKKLKAENSIDIWQISLKRQDSLSAAFDLVNQLICISCLIGEVTLWAGC